VSLANSLCVKLGIGPERDPDRSLVDEESARMLSLDPARIEHVSAAVQERLAEEKSQLSLA
jgi:hypothetical protein